MKDEAAREDKERDPRKRGGKSVNTGAVAVIVAALISAAVAIYLNNKGGNRRVIVPSVRGEVEAIADNKLDDRGFGVYVRKRRFSARLRGEIISQDPAGGTSAEAGSTVALVVSKGKPPTPCIHLPIHSASIRGSASITMMKGRARVGSVVNPLQGAYRNLAPRSDLWVLVYSANADLFYPQSHRTDRPATLLSSGRFRSAAFFGGAPGEHYEVIVVLARKRASRSLSATLRRWARAEDFSGLTAGELPFGMDEKDCATVELRRG